MNFLPSLNKWSQIKTIFKCIFQNFSIWVYSSKISWHKILIAAIYFHISSKRHKIWTGPIINADEAQIILFTITLLISVDRAWHLKPQVRLTWQSRLTFEMQTLLSHSLTAVSLRWSNEECLFFWLYNMLQKMSTTCGCSVTWAFSVDSRNVYLIMKSVVSV